MGYLAGKIRRMDSAAVLVFSFVAAIGAGTSLLMLPAATVSGKILFIDALFTATSAVCVTGLAVVDTGSYYTIFGQIVILILIQIGGLGVMTISVTVFRLIGKNISFKQRLIMQDIFTHTPKKDILSLVKMIFLITGMIELFGASVLFIRWSGEYPVAQAFYLSLFHSVSAFCNAGFSLFSNSMIGYRADRLVNIMVSILIVLGGIGFPVLYDLFHAGIRRRERNVRLSIQTKIVLATSALLIFSGSVFFFYLERNFILKGKSLSEGILISVFQSITCRTAGFNTVDIGSLQMTTLAVMIFLMFFGASPGSCGGGVKTTTLALIGSFAWSRMKGDIRVHLFKKSIPSETIARSTSLILISLGMVAAIFFLVLISIPESTGIQNAYPNGFLVYLFETVSAFGTVGLSMGATSGLTGTGKSLIIAMMLIGRVGVLAFSYAFVGPVREKGIEYAEENVMIG